jgi:hypothetical protein
MLILQVYYLIKSTWDNNITKEEKILQVCSLKFQLFVIQLLHHRQQGAKNGTLRTMVAYSLIDEFAANPVEEVEQET